MALRKMLGISKKQKIIIGIAGIFVILAGWWAYTSFMPHPLGDRLEYLGKVDSGCLFVCDAQPGSTYYYGTDMTPEEVVRYFKKATPANTEDLIDLDKNLPRDLRFSLKPPSTDNPIYIKYLSPSKEHTQTHNFKKSSKQYIITVSNEDYEAARASL